MPNAKPWFYGVGVAWILLTTIYFHIHFIGVFIQANRTAIESLWR